MPVALYGLEILGWSERGRETRVSGWLYKEIADRGLGSFDLGVFI